MGSVEYLNILTTPSRHHLLGSILMCPLFVHQLQDPALWSYARGRRKYDFDSEFWKLGHGELKYVECGQEAQQAWISSDFSRMWSVS